MYLQSTRLEWCILVKLAPYLHLARIVSGFACTRIGYDVIYFLDRNPSINFAKCEMRKINRKQIRRYSENEGEQNENHCIIKYICVITRWIGNAHSFRNFGIAARTARDVVIPLSNTAMIVQWQFVCVRLVRKPFPIPIRIYRLNGK